MPNKKTSAYHPKLPPIVLIDAKSPKDGAKSLSIDLLQVYLWHTSLPILRSTNQSTKSWKRTNLNAYVANLGFEEQIQTSR